MKKKGLIVATIVMVLVLAVSITTATYAWFTADSSTSVNEIAVSVKSGSDVLVGIKTNNTVSDDATEMAAMANYIYGACEWNSTDNVWTGGSETLGTELALTGAWTNWGSAIGTGQSGQTVYVEDGTPTVEVGKYVLVESEYIELTSENCGTGKTYDPATFEGKTYTQRTNQIVGDAAWNAATGHDLIAANGQGSAAPTENISLAVENKDYIHLVLGIAAGKDNIETITCNVTVKGSESTKAKLGCLAALHYANAVDEKAAYTTTTEFYTGDTYNTDKKDSNAVAILVAGTVGGGALSQDAVHYVDLYVFLVGYDTDCISAGMGVGCSIAIDLTCTYVD